ncbi:MAG TPA: asparagine synthase (glutamine-hydrolyzing) [Candidatus Omnitrophota bacterium]|nr:asparagine synthase (glutamine-hydrolyzing) [Candidatus Omnitrophota bacterium]HRZ15848.1 asparagine synthase (glutamine-hydrolyzing) [Candidatus Omnitrophota bacterium]
MCGIAGIIAKKRLFEKSRLEAMSAALAHRGPDDRGMDVLACAGNQEWECGLAHRRLAIIDTTASGHQPMADRQQRFRLTYNGEIYNYRQLRSELEEKGYEFVSHSDSEVIIAAYQEWAAGCLEKLRGMFAFALLDTQREVVFCAVDRFGIKPFYYSCSPAAHFVFASELRSVLASGLVARQIDPLAVDSYLAFGAVQAPLTMIRDVRVLLPGTLLIFDLKSGTCRIQSYWQPFADEERGSITDPREAVALVQARLLESVEAHLVSDVPVGLFLSGGIDSSSIAALANGTLKAGLRSFSVVFAEDRFSEARYSQLVAGRYCPEHTRIQASQDDVLKIIPRAIAAMDQPTIDGINVYFISQAVRQRGIKVVLSGQGGDEVFGGYSTFQRMFWARLFSAAAGWLPFWRLPGGKDMFRVGTVKTIGILQAKADPVELYAVLRQLFSPAARHALLADGASRGPRSGIQDAVAESLRGQVRGLDLFSAVSLLEMRGYLANMLLRDCDFMSNSHALEVRVPFLDHELVAAIAQVCPAIKARRPAKYLLRRAMADMLPPELFRRPKMGFVFPWEIWMRDRLKQPIDEQLYGFEQAEELGVNIGQCRRLWELFKNHQPGLSWSRPWAVYVLLSWLKKNVRS